MKTRKKRSPLTKRFSAWMNEFIHEGGIEALCKALKCLVQGDERSSVYVSHM